MDDAGRAHAAGAARLRVAAVLTLAMVVMYFGFISLVAFDRPLLARLVVPGLSLGILFGALVIVFSWLLTFGYVRWANAHDDDAPSPAPSGGTPLGGTGRSGVAPNDAAR